MERFDIKARLSNVVAAARDGGDAVEIISGEIVVARLSPTLAKGSPPRRTELFDPEAWSAVHAISAPFAVKDGTALIRALRDE